MTVAIGAIGRENESTFQRKTGSRATSWITLIAQNIKYLFSSRDNGI